MTAAKLQGKVAIVTGAALGMGNAVARRFSAEGANVVVADIRDAEGKALADELGPAAVFAAHDVSDEAGWITGAEIYIDGGSMAGPRPVRARSAIVSGA